MLFRSQESVAQEEKASENIQKNIAQEEKTAKKDKAKKEKNNEIHRYNIEIPNDVFLELKEFTKSTGYNLKGFFLTAAKEKMKREKVA